MQACIVNGNKYKKCCRAEGGQQVNLLHESSFCSSALTLVLTSGKIHSALHCVQACILSGNKYNTRCRKEGGHQLDVLDECNMCISVVCSCKWC